MALERTEVSRKVYKGRTIVVRFLGPDVLGEVDGVEMGNMYLSAEACYRVAERDIDKAEAEKAKEVLDAAKKVPGGRRKK